jgi:hypothetical protein
MVAEGFESFGKSIEAKLIREISELPPAASEASAGAGVGQGWAGAHLYECPESTHCGHSTEIGSSNGDQAFLSTILDL